MRSQPLSILQTAYFKRIRVSPYFGRILCSTEYLVSRHESQYSPNHSRETVLTGRHSSFVLTVSLRTQVLHSSGMAHTDTAGTLHSSHSRGKTRHRTSMRHNPRTSTASAILHITAGPFVNRRGCAERAHPLYTDCREGCAKLHPCGLIELVEFVLHVGSNDTS